MLQSSILQQDAKVYKDLANHYANLAINYSLAGNKKQSDQFSERGQYYHRIHEELMAQVRTENKMYRTFSKMSDLNDGDVIRLISFASDDFYKLDSHLIGGAFEVRKNRLIPLDCGSQTLKNYGLFLVEGFKAIQCKAQ